MIKQFFLVCIKVTRSNGEQDASVAVESGHDSKGEDSELTLNLSDNEVSLHKIVKQRCTNYIFINSRSRL